MRSRFRPCIEQLEAQTLLSGVLPAFTATMVHSDPFKPAVLPAPAPTLAVKVTTDRAVYLAGQPVQVTITVTNTSNQDVDFPDYPPSEFLITQNGQTIAQPSAIERTGGVSPQIISVVVLCPGQSHTVRFTWDGHSVDSSGHEGALVTGTFHVWSQYAVRQQRTGGPPAVPVTIMILPVPTPAAQG
jgi:hypothetical protein